MKILITGTREPSEAGLKKLCGLLEKSIKKYPTMQLIHGGAKGTDSEAEKWAKQHKIETEVIRPDYEKYHYKAAPLKRNTELVKKCEVVIALYGKNGKSGGTKDTVDKTIKANKPLLEIYDNGKTKYYKPQTTLNLK